MKCSYDLAWIGFCGQPADGEFCEKHVKERCVSCGAQATRQCSMAASFVCGWPLCPNCDHNWKETRGTYAKEYHLPLSVIEKLPPYPKKEV